MYITMTESTDDINIKKSNELLDVQSSHVIKYILTNIILLGKLETKQDKKFDKVLKQLHNILPFKPIGTILIEDPTEGKVWLSIKPCVFDHSFELQLSSIPSIIQSEEKKKKLMHTISMMVHVVRKEYTRFINANEALITSLLSLLPVERKDISLKIDMENTTLYVYEDFPLRSGIYLERNSYVNSKIDKDYTVENADLNIIISESITQIEEAIKAQKLDLEGRVSI
jgi:hypothetical protein